MGDSAGAEFGGAFSAFWDETQPLSQSRRKVAAAARRPEQESVAAALAEAESSDAYDSEARERARALVAAMRAAQGGGPAALLFVEFGLSSHEGVALMCLAEALLRIPDRATRDEFIRSKIVQGDWARSLGRGRSIFVNAAAWALLVGKFIAADSHEHLSHVLTRALRRGGEPIVRAALDFVMRMLGERFVLGQNIESALIRARTARLNGYNHSFDMLGESAVTREEASAYRDAYAQAIRAVGESEPKSAPTKSRPGISIKLSALHPRFERAQRARLVAELHPVVIELVTLARQENVGVNIDAEEADKLDLKLDCFEALCAQPHLSGWDGLGFVVQSYQKRALALVDHLIVLARGSRRRIMARLVKGAYWDSEIKQAQIRGLEFPVFTRKAHADCSYLACANRLLAAEDAIYPQFATHNVQSAIAVDAMARSAGRDDWEFQCLYGMGEQLYETARGSGLLKRACRIYAPVGKHETLLPYLVRRLLENGASASFVRRLADPSVSNEDLVENPIASARRVEPLGSPDPRIREARNLFGSARENSPGFDLDDELALRDLSARLRTAAFKESPETMGSRRLVVIRDATDPLRPLGIRPVASAADIDARLAAAQACEARWARESPSERADALRRAADRLAEGPEGLIALIVREAGRTIADACAETREAIDFLRYYAEQAEDLGHPPSSAAPLGTVACISPWNFPLSIFLGQVAAALAAGNCVVAKPAEQTPLTAVEAVRILHAAGVPRDALSCLVGDGSAGAALVADPRIQAVLFTGSLETARSIARALARRLGAGGHPVPFVAETAGLNAMIVDSSALLQQAAKDILVSAFDSAGQRCSSLRVLCMQEEIADDLMRLVEGGLRELSMGLPDRLSTDVGPLIDEEAGETVRSHVALMRGRGRQVLQRIREPSTAQGWFVAPAVVRIDRFSDLRREVFGPVLHVLRYRREGLEGLLDEIASSGYGLALGVHSRVDSALQTILARRLAGNCYVNRNMIGAVVGVQPFGGHGLSGTGPKAGGPLYLRRITRAAGRLREQAETVAPPGAAAWRIALLDAGRQAVRRFDSLLARSPFGAKKNLAGPDGERNTWELAPRGSILCLAEEPEMLLDMAGAAVATGNRPILWEAVRPRIPVSISALADYAADPFAPGLGEAALFSGSDQSLLDAQRRFADREGPIVPIHRIAGPDDIPLVWLMRELSVSINLAASGGAFDLVTLDG